MSAAPFLTIRYLRQLDHEDSPDFPLARQLLVTCNDVDDIIARADSIEEIMLIQQQVISLLERGCFQLKK